MVKLPFWLQREHRLWEEFVPLDVRKRTIENGWALPYEQEMVLAESMVVNP